MTRRDRSIRNVLDKLALVERLAREVRKVLMAAEREELAKKPVKKASAAS